VGAIGGLNVVVNTYYVNQSGGPAKGVQGKKKKGQVVNAWVITKKVAPCISVENAGGSKIKNGGGVAGGKGRRAGEPRGGARVLGKRFIARV